MDSALQFLSEAQRRLVTNAQLIASQVSRQKEFCENIVKKSKELTNELRLLSIVRSKIIKNKIRSTEQIVSSPSFQGLKMSKIEYCPPFISPNLINHYTYFCTYMRKNPEILAKVLFEYSKKNPQKVTTLAYSLFLTLYQQGWCIEEDLKIFEILTCMADLQFNVDKPNSNWTNQTCCQPCLPRKLKYSLDLSDAAVGKYLPFVAFSTAYLFNGASFSYLQSSLAPIILKLHSLSSLYDLRTTFEAKHSKDRVSMANYSYWGEILLYSKQILDALEKCLPLLPPSTFGLFAYLKSMNADLFLIFFEGFINRALDNPAVLGLLPWHPSHGNWNPSKDIADVFRTKSLKSLPSKHLGNLSKILDNFPEYEEINIDNLLDLLLIPPDSQVSYMISEAELLSTNPAFPKELLITTKDIALLHQATLEFSELDDNLRKIIKNLGPVAKKDENSMEHFRIVITRQVNKNKPASLSISPMSLFSNTSGDFEIVKKSTPYAEFLCDILSELPSPQELSSASIPEFIERVRSLSNFFVPAKNINQADAVLWYASKKFIDDKSFMQKIALAVDNRECRAMSYADKTSSLRTQNERMENYLFIVKSMRKNLRSNLTLEFAEAFVKNDMCQQFIEASYHSHNFVNDIKIFKNVVSHVLKEANNALVKMNIDTQESKEVCRILFFKLTEHVTFGRYMQSDPTVWKRSVIVSKILEDKKDEILEIALKDQPKCFQNNIPYLQRASDLLGHIRPNSGISVIVYYVLETVDLIQTLCNNCKELNFDGCLIWTFMKSKAKHIYILSKFIQHFLLSENLLDKFLSHSEISGLSVLPSGVMYLIKICHQYDKRIILEWA